ncbi:unnamed protein product [Oikopleura dioica]|uniref:EF-hand domain-containing protein n=1 Tax=Oikopleura dioica TaxID=34765 RepID=E4X068_OIKDI|nr:unnamed protein product [Oikopleura dioica]
MSFKKLRSRLSSKGSAKSDRKGGATKDASSDIKLKVAEEAKIRENPFENKLIESNFDFAKWEKYFPRETIISHKETFDSFDIDEGGTISRAELQTSIAHIRGRTVTEGEVDAILHKCDLNSDGELGFSEFLLMMLTVSESEKAYHELYEAFGVFETIEKELIKKRPGHQHQSHRNLPPEGAISRSFLLQALKGHGEPLSEEELTHFINVMESSGSDESHFHYPFFVESITGEVHVSSFRRSDLM